MLKVFGFVQRHERLSHDEYRAAHAGYHNSYGRRLNGIRGYLLNVQANRSLMGLLPTDLSGLAESEHVDFDGQWDGYGQLMFDDLASYLSAKSAARDRPGPDGLESDSAVAAVGGDAPHLYAGPPVQFHVAEYPVVPVRRPEHKLFKLVQFGKRHPDLSPEEFTACWSGSYAAHCRNKPGLLGHIVNVRTDLDVISGFFTEESGAYTEAARSWRRDFLARFDGIAEYWFTSPDAFVSFRRSAGEALRTLEQHLFSDFFFREVDETVAVLPDRLPPPPFYHR